MKVKIMAALLVLVIGLSCLGVNEVKADSGNSYPDPYSADSFRYGANDELYKSISKYDTYIVVESNGYLLMFAGNGVYYKNGQICFSGGYGVPDYSHTAYLSLVSGLWHNTSSGTSQCVYDWPIQSLLNSLVEDAGLSDVTFSDYSFNMVYSSQDITDGSGNVVYPKGGYTNGVKEIYNSLLGYLNNLIEKTVYLKDSEGNIDYSTSQRIVGFDSLSTSGLDLSTGEYSIRVYEQGCYYGHDVTTVYKDDYPLIYIGEYAIENNSIMYDPWEARDKTTTETEGWLSDWDLYWGQYERRDNMYYQIVKTNDDGSIEYGGYVKVVRLTDNDDGISSTVTPELVPDTDGGFSDDRVDSGIGSGTNYEDAEMNADQDLENNINNPDVSGDIAKDIQSLIAYIGAVPQLLSALLSFLPEEYQQLIFVAFALMLGLIVIKTVRG